MCFCAVLQVLFTGSECFLGEDGDRVAILQSATQPSVGYVFEQEGVSPAVILSSPNDLHLGFIVNVTSLSFPRRFAVAAVVDNGLYSFLSSCRYLLYCFQYIFRCCFFFLDLSRYDEQNVICRADLSIPAELTTSAPTTVNLVGPTGPKGDIGPIGSTGATGPTGSKGQKGDIGLQG